MQTYPRSTLVTALVFVQCLAACGGGGAGSSNDGGGAGIGAVGSGGSGGSAGAGAGGNSGAAGTRGAAGAVGAAGSSGAAGAVGTAGATGAAGAAGNAGAAGVIGAGGSAGTAGASGSSGAGGSNTGGGGTAGSSASGGSGGGAGASGHWKPAQATTFYWDLSNTPPDNTKNVGAYDIDGWGNTAQEVATLHARGVKVVCYMDAGTYEPGRPDSSTFPTSLKGKAVQGWPGEFWVDVRAAGPNHAALQAIMAARFKVCHDKGFDAVEPDNLDSYENDPGFATTAADQLAYNEWIATTVHGLGLAVFQKNDLDQVVALQPSFDGILDEECNKYSECSSLAPYTAAGKPVWDAEYKEDGESTSAFCSKDVSASIVGALFALDLDGSVFEPCSNDVGMTN
jgi:hypothetical protein